MGSNSHIKFFLKGVHDDYIPSISKSGRAQAAAVRSVKTNGSVRTNDSFPLGKQLRRLGQGTGRCQGPAGAGRRRQGDRKSTRLNSSHSQISYAVFCLKKKKKKTYEHKYMTPNP